MIVHINCCMYNDYRLIDEDKLFAMQKEYSKKLQVRVENFENAEKSHNLLYNLLLTSKQILESLINNSKSFETKTQIKQILENINKNIERFEGLFEIVEKEEKTFNFEFNLKSLVSTLLNFLSELFELISLENNMKMLVVFREIFKEILEDVKILNNISLSPKILTLFKNHR